MLSLGLNKCSGHIHIHLFSTLYVYICLIIYDVFYILIYILRPHLIKFSVITNETGVSGSILGSCDMIQNLMVACSSPDGVIECFSAHFFQPHYGPGVYSASNLNEYQKIFVKRRVPSHPVRLATSPPSLSRLSRQCDKLRYVC
jgi:hypothetical protein